ncbi:MAG: hypothetical protein IJH48_09495 [Oscillospiraceae bacterium]|nr:hypothetical protein [Oscillospiraceae bacterium]
MNTEKTIPIIIGVTAHRSIRERDRAAIAASVRRELQKLQTLCPHSRLVMLNSLAEGGDLLCADAAEELGIPLIAALPMERALFEEDFSAEALERLDHHCRRAEQVFVTPPAEAVPDGPVSRNFLFRQSGIYVSAHSHILLALWDGGPGTQAACGTAETVDFSLHGSYMPLSGTAVRSEANEAVIHIYTPRTEQPREPAGTVHLLGNTDAVRDILRRSDEFNCLAADTKTEGGRRVPLSEPDPLLERMENVSKAAGSLSVQNAGKLRFAFGLLAVASALLTFAFLMYDEAQAIWMILVCGLMLLAAWLCRRWAVRSDCHRRYIEYRALAESLRVQIFLRYAGSRIRTEELLPWTQQEETAWIMDALCALNTGKEPETAHDIRMCWAEAQRAYHREAGKRSGHDLLVSTRTVRFALVLSITLYLAAVIFELLCGGLIFRPLVHVTDVELYRTILKIAMGTISAVTLFVANYYGRLSLSRTLSDHQKMERFFRKMSERLAEQGQTEELLRVLAREELIENGNWCSYQRDNTPDVSI